MTTPSEVHTPLPWQSYTPRGEPPVLKSTRDLPNGQRITEWIGTLHGSAGWDNAVNEANASLIVTAVNERPKLLERVRVLEEALKPFAEAAKLAEASGRSCGEFCDAGDYERARALKAE